MYRTVYWHRQIRSATAMIKKALLAGLTATIIAPEELYDLDDQGLFALMASRVSKLGTPQFEPFSLAAQVRDGKLFSEAASFPYDEAQHSALRDIEKRRAQGEALATETGRVTGKNISAESLIIDVPEPVSFETELFVRDEDRPFGESSSAFKKSTLEAFVRSLQTVRIFTAVPTDIPESVLHKSEKWLHL
jgi:HD superfamily phosphohydrolase